MTPTALGTRGRMAKSGRARRSATRPPIRQKSPPSQEVSRFIAKSPSVWKLIQEQAGQNGVPSIFAEVTGQSLDDGLSAASRLLNQRQSDLDEVRHPKYEPIPRDIVFDYDVRALNLALLTTALFWGVGYLLVGETVADFLFREQPHKFLVVGAFLGISAVVLLASSTIIDDRIQKNDYKTKLDHAQRMTEQGQKQLTSQKHNFDWFKQTILEDWDGLLAVIEKDLEATRSFYDDVMREFFETLKADVQTQLESTQERYKQLQDRLHAREQDLPREEDLIIRLTLELAHQRRLIDQLNQTLAQYDQTIQGLSDKILQIDERILAENEAQKLADDYNLVGEAQRARQVLVSEQIKRDQLLDDLKGYSESLRGNTVMLSQARVEVQNLVTRGK